MFFVGEVCHMGEFLGSWYVLYLLYADRRGLSDVPVAPDSKLGS